MTTKKMLVAAMLAASLGALSVPTYAAIIVGAAPPALRVEVVPAPRRGYLWVNGHWDWRNGRHQWVAGTWVRERHGYAYNPSRWEERDGRWHLDRGGWRRGDRDGDGVPNRQDRAPDNPYRR